MIVKRTMKCMTAIPTKVTAVMWNHFMRKWIGTIFWKIMKIIQKRTVLEERIEEYILQGIAEESILPLMKTFLVKQPLKLILGMLL